MNRIAQEEALNRLQHASLETLAAAGQECRYWHNPREQVSYILDSNPNYTNVCVADCSFCSFYRPPGHKQAYTKSVDEVMESFELARQAGLSTILLQGGLHPELTLDYYLELLKQAHLRYPEIHCHFFSAPEIYHLAQVSHLSIQEVLQALYDAGQRTLPGGGAEILSESIRRKISPKKMAPGAWIEVHRCAHRVGMRSTATMMYGHLEGAHHLIEHLESLRRLQDETGGFTAFIPWSYKRSGNSLGRLVDQVADEEAYWRIIAVARVYLDNFSHIQASWFSEGQRAGVEALRYGADDFGGLILEEEVHQRSGYVHKQTARAVIKMIHDAGFDAVERSPLYTLMTHWPRGTLPELHELHQHKMQVASENGVGPSTLQRWQFLR